ncbi:MAG: nucleoside recognition domain-containing protein [Eubacteriales bacterium]|nr:nucleoside recognition domain-containing protein [Eubacteriales bacterium]MDD3199449.1 nucleoside recognition domain-containing protein [Eubacteriales bacterium]MDD4122520.1 nucleoside recognition domain-containing protein [Eubacteriales bacterium]MDD4629696.1 nucleoside recognition domain-containing protein [Eubacteriales bacterium]
MMNYIWAGMLILGIVFAVINGRLNEFSDGLMKSCTNGVYFVIGLAGIMAVWSGIMNIAKETGLIDFVADKTKPLIRFLFPVGLKKETTAMILMSFTANVFGAGNSATVFSIKAMEMLDAENHRKTAASNEMCMFIAVNMSMIQLVPITVIKISSEAGSINAGNIIIPSILAGLVSMAASIFICKLYERKRI